MQIMVAGQETFVGGAQLPDDDLPTIVMVHGAAMDHTVWAAYSRYYRHLGRSVLAPDLPGHGRSAGEIDSIEGYAGWLIELLDKVGVVQVALVGHSMGALIALESAARLGARAERLALLGIACPMPVSQLLLDEAAQDSSGARDMMMIWGHGQSAQYGANPNAGFHIMKSATRLLESAKPGVLHRDLAACNAYTTGLDRASEVSAQTTLIVGTEDRMTPAKAANEIMSKMGDCRVESITGSGHMMMSEQPEATHQCLVTAIL